MKVVVEFDVKLNKNGGIYLVDELLYVNFPPELGLKLLDAVKKNKMKGVSK